MIYFYPPPYKINNCHSELVSESPNLRKPTQTISPSQRRKGFTLAETLITLVIIGVIAAITVPIVYNRIHNQLLANQFKVGYSLLNTGFKNILTKDGVTKMDETALIQDIVNSGHDTDNPETEAKTIRNLSRGFNNIKINTRGEMKQSTACKDLVGTGTKYWKLGDRTQCSGHYNASYKLANGMIMSFFASETACNSGSCAQVWLDTNGPKGPNEWGRDAFSFILMNSGAVVAPGTSEYTQYIKDVYQPYISQGLKSEEQLENSIQSSLICDVASHSHSGCAAKIIKDGYQMNY